MTGHAPPRRGARDAAALSAALTRRWVDGYTGWVGADAAERRRDEIASDVWEQRAEATARGVPPSAVAFSIVSRVIAGIPADLLWVHAQRLAMRNQPARRKVLTMNALGHIAAHWWWVIGAAALAVVGTIALFTGGPDLARLQVLLIVALLAAGVALRYALPRTAGTLVVVGATIPAVLIWAPWLMVIGIATLLGAAVEVVRLTEGVARRMLAAIGLAALAGAWLWIGGLGGAGSGPTDPALWGPIVLGLVGIALVVVTGTRHRPVAAA